MNACCFCFKKEEEIVILRVKVSDESIKQIAKKVASKFSGVTKVVEVEGEGQLEVRGEFSISELRKKLKKIDESVETNKIVLDGATKQEIKIQQQDEGKRPVNIQKSSKPFNDDAISSNQTAPQNYRLTWEQAKVIGAAAAEQAKVIGEKAKAIGEGAFNLLPNNIKLNYGKKNNRKEIRGVAPQRWKEQKNMQEKEKEEENRRKQDLAKEEKIRQEKEQEDRRKRALAKEEKIRQEKEQEDKRKRDLAKEEKIRQEKEEEDRRKRALAKEEKIRQEKEQENRRKRALAREEKIRQEKEQENRRKRALAREEKIRHEKEQEDRRKRALAKEEKIRREKEEEKRKKQALENNSGGTSMLIGIAGSLLNTISTVANASAQALEAVQRSTSTQAQRTGQPSTSTLTQRTVQPSTLTQNPFSTQRGNTTS